MTTLDEFNRWLSQPEGSHLEFKEAKSQYDMKDILDYCTALANEGGGKLVLGVNEQSRKEVSPQKLSNIMQSLKMLGLVTRAGPRKTGYWLLSKLDLNKSKTEAKDQVSGFHKPK